MTLLKEGKGLVYSKLLFKEKKMWFEDIFLPSFSLSLLNEIEMQFYIFKEQCPFCQEIYWHSNQRTCSGYKNRASVKESLGKPHPTNTGDNSLENSQERTKKFLSTEASNSIESLLWKKEEGAAYMRDSKFNLAPCSEILFVTGSNWDISATHSPGLFPTLDCVI